MKISVVGTGYVGLVTGTCLAETGNTVTCVDIDEKKVDKLRNGIIPIYEPGLNEIFERNVSEKRLFFTTSLEEGVKDAQVVFLALPTPPGEDGSADLKYILKVASDLGDLITDYKVIIDKSTVPVGTAEKVASILDEKLDDEMYDVVSNPEFLREGYAVDDFLKPDRIVIGSSSDEANKVLKRLYAPFVRQGNPIIFMDERSAEMTKYAANSYLATRITFMNEIANLCDQVGANVDFVRKGMGTDSRIGKRFLFPGIGYGGSCFPKDVQALHKTAKLSDYDFRILDSVMDVNNRQKLILVEKLLEHFEGDIHGLKVAIWGLSFKPNTDDIREAPALYIIDELLNKGANISAYDPEAMENVANLYGDKITLTHSNYDCLENADALLICTEWGVFRSPDFVRIKNRMKQHKIFDGRNIFDSDYVRSIGFHYESIGRPQLTHSDDEA